MSQYLLRGEECEDGLYGRIAVQKRNDIKRRPKTGKRSSKIKSSRLMNPISKSLAQIGRSMFGEELVKDLQPLYHSNHRSGSVIELEAFAKCKVGNLNHKKSKMNLTGFHSILQYHANPSGTRLVAQRFILMQDTDPKHTSKRYQRYIKNKEELQLMSWPAHSADLNPIELVWDALDRNVKAKRSTKAIHIWQFLQDSCAELFSVYFRSLVKRIPRICEAMIAANGSPFDELQPKGVLLMKMFVFKKMFCAFFNLFFGGFFV